MFKTTMSDIVEGMVIYHPDYHWEGVNGKLKPDIVHVHNQGEDCGDSTPIWSARLDRDSCSMCIY